MLAYRTIYRHLSSMGVNYRGGTGDESLQNLEWRTLMKIDSQIFTKSRSEFTKSKHAIPSGKNHFFLRRAFSSFYQVIRLLSRKNVNEYLYMYLYLPIHLPGGPRSLPHNQAF